MLMAPALVRYRTVWMRTMEEDLDMIQLQVTTVATLKVQDGYH